MRAPLRAIVPGELQRVAELAVHPRQHRLEKPAFVDPGKVKCSAVVRHDPHLCRIRAEHASDPAPLKFPQPQNPERIAMPGLDQRIKIVVGKK